MAKRKARKTRKIVKRKRPARPWIPPVDYAKAARQRKRIEKLFGPIKYLAVVFLKEKRVLDKGRVISVSLYQG